MMASGVYDIPKIEVDITAVVTNSTPTGPVRGAGRPEASQMIERAIDIFAAEAGLDPAEVRRRNFIAADAFPFTTAVGATYDVGDYAGALERALEQAGYDELRREQAQRRADGSRSLLGIGLSVYVEITNGIGEGEFGAVEITDDGGAIVRTGSFSHGQGHETTFAQIVAQRTGIDVENIQVVAGDTDRVPRGTGTYGSKSTQIGGAAAGQASEMVVDRAKQLAAEPLEANPEDMVLDLDGGRFHVAGAPEPALAWADLAARLEADGQLAELSVETDFKPEQPTFPFGAHVAVVEVDADTGSVRLVRMIACDDAGTIINPMIAEGQVHGGLAAGIAQALYEEVRYDAEGNPQHANLVTYCIPSAAEMPSFERVVMETPTPVNPLGAKGIGESGTIGATPAVHNAVIDALVPPRRAPRRDARQRREHLARDRGGRRLQRRWRGSRPRWRCKPSQRRGYSQSSRSATPSMAASGRWRSGTVCRSIWPLIPLRTSTVREPPIRPRAMSIPRSSPITASSAVGMPSRRRSSATAARDGLPSTRGRAPVTLAIAAAIIELRLKIIPLAPA